MSKLWLKFASNKIDEFSVKNMKGDELLLWSDVASQSYHRQFSSDSTYSVVIGVDDWSAEVLDLLYEHAASACTGKVSLSIRSGSFVLSSLAMVESFKNSKGLVFITFALVGSPPKIKRTDNYD